MFVVLCGVFRRWGILGVLSISRNGEVSFGVF